MIKHTLLVRKATNLLGFTGIILGVLFISGLLIYKTWFLPDSVICDQWLPSTVSSVKLSGTVLSISRDVLSSDTCRVVLEIDNFGDLLWCKCASSEEAIAMINIGDSLYKEINSLDVTICSSPSSCATFDFPCCE